MQIGENNSIYWIDGQMVEEYWDPERFLNTKEVMPLTKKDPKEFLEVFMYDQNDIAIWMARLNDSQNFIHIAELQILSGTVWDTNSPYIPSIRDMLNKMDAEKFKLDYQLFCTHLMLAGVNISPENLDDFLDSLHKLISDNEKNRA